MWKKFSPESVKNKVEDWFFFLHDVFFKYAGLMKYLGFESGCIYEYISKNLRVQFNVYAVVRS